jgi:hypothetical protein
MFAEDDGGDGKMSKVVVACIVILRLILPVSCTESGVVAGIAKHIHQSLCVRMAQTRPP